MKNNTHGLFPSPVYITRRELDLDSTEKKEIEDFIEEGMITNMRNSSSNNSYIFNAKLKNLKEFCEHHIKIYVKEIISPKEKLDFYITQSWINVNKPGESHHQHAHPNSIISGVFYVLTTEDDSINFYDPNSPQKDRLRFDPVEFNVWNSPMWTMPAEKNNLILFPSWLDHSVSINEKATTDRISLSFNTFVRGNFGGRDRLSELSL